MDPLFGVVLADLDGQNLRFRKRLAGHRLNLRVCVCSFYFSRMRNIIMAGPSTHLQFAPARVLSIFRYDAWLYVTYRNRAETDNVTAQVRCTKANLHCLLEGFSFPSLPIICLVTTFQ